MTSEPTPVSVEQLLAESAWVRALAHRLVFDAEAADDVVQQTWVEALQRGEEPRHVRAWLGGVVRNVVRRQHRGRRRREDHERRAPALPPDAPAADLVERAELFGVVVDAVLSLHEPFRSTVVQRYFAGLEPVEIATRDGVPAATVRTRLHRALGLLRERLDAHAGGDRRRWTLGLAPLLALAVPPGVVPPGAALTVGAIPTGVAPVSTLAVPGGAATALAVPGGAATTLVSTGVLAMTLKTTFAMVGTLAVLGAAAWMLTVDERSASGGPGASGPAGGSVASVAANAEGPAASLATPADHRPPPAPQPDGPEPLRAIGAATTAPDPVGALVYGSVVDPAGAPVVAPHTRVQLTSEAGATRSVELADGTYAVAGLAPGSWSLALDVSGFLPVSLALELQAGVPQRQDLLLQRSVVLPVRVLTPAGESTQTLLDAGAPTPFDSLRLTVVATMEPPAGDLPETPHRGYGRYGVGSYRANSKLPWDPPSDDLPADCDGVLELSVPPPVWASVVARHVVLASQEVPPGATELLFVVPVELVTGVLGDVRLLVVDAESGAPLPEARVALNDSQSGGPGRPVEADGSAAFLALPPGPRDLIVSAPGHASLRRSLRVPAGGQLDLGELPLDPATTLAGRVLDTEGQPVSTALYVLPVDRFDRDAGFNRRHSWQSDGEGRFRIGDVGRERYTIASSRPGWAARPQVIDARQGDVTDLVVLVEPAFAVTLQASWGAGEAASLSVFAANGTPVSHVPRLEGGASWPLHLLPGEYRYVVGERGQVREFRVEQTAARLSLMP